MDKKMGSSIFMGRFGDQLQHYRLHELPLVSA